MSFYCRNQISLNDKRMETERLNGFRMIKYKGTNRTVVCFNSIRYFC